MFRHTPISVLILTIFLSLPCLWAVDKPTERTEDCTTSECHNSYRQQSHVHKPVSLGVCKFCHKSVDPKEHTFELFRTGRELCGSCHEEKTVDLKGIPTLEQLRPKAQVGEGRYIHEPLEEGHCIDCHNPHSSDYEYLILSARIGDVCIECHEMDENVKTAHEPVAKGECTKCHDSHSSDFENLLIEDQKQLCFSCHEDTEAELNRFEYAHPPALDHECGDCHEPHGSDYFRLLISSYPSEFYAPLDISDYDLCFSCHREDIVLIEKTVTLTDFRNGETNLHYLHVNMPERGRTCRACHATHASDEPKHLRKEVPYGEWSIPIGFEKTETGGSCTPGCHNPLVYDRISPAVYPSDTDQAVSSFRGRGGTTGAPACCSLKNLTKKL